MSSSDQEQTEQERSIDTKGGTYIEGDIYTQGGDFVAGDQIIIQQAAFGVVSLHQLPPPPPDFTGRESELTEHAQAITQGGVTVSSVRGMGGVGKTALALKLAQQLTSQYPDAQFYLDLRGTSDSPLTPVQAMAHIVRAYHPTIRLPDTERELRGLYYSVLYGQRAILLMDNAANREQVEPLLCPDCCVLLVTSRRRFTLPGLKALNLDTLLPKDAQALLLKIAPRICSHADEIAELCGHLPLALRLAGSVLAEREPLQPQDYLQRLADAQTRLGLIDASLSLSYDLLQEELRRLWCALCVFPGTFDYAAAAAVWQMGEHPTQEALGELLRCSLIEWNPDTRRYRLHDLARLFAGAHLDESERFVAQRHHAKYYIAVLGAADELYRRGGESSLSGLALFDLEWHNIETGESWAAEILNRDDTSVRLCMLYPNAGRYCLDLRQHPRDRIEWLKDAVKAARHLEHREAEGMHLGNLGSAYYYVGQVERAIEFFQQAQVIAQEIGDRTAESQSLDGLGSAYSDLKQMERAIECYQQAWAIAQEIRAAAQNEAEWTNARRVEGNCLGNLAIAYRTLGQVGRAIEFFQQARAIAQEIGDRRAEGAHLSNLGIAYFSLRQVDRTIEFFQQALAISQEIGDRRGEAFRSWNLGLLYEGTDPAKAIELMSVRVAYEREIGHPDAEAHAEHIAQIQTRLDT